MNTSNQPPDAASSGASDSAQQNEYHNMDAYELLSIPRDASKSDIKKAYHRAALTSHPDKVPESERSHAEIRFKAVSRAYEVLSDTRTRTLYDTHGWSAFTSGSSSGMDDFNSINVDDVLEQLFGGMNFGGGGSPGGFPGMPGFGGPAFAQRPTEGGNGPDEVQDYEVGLEDMYRGKTTRFASTKNVECPTCKGSGAKSDKVKKVACSVCNGAGRVQSIIQLGPTAMTRTTNPCTNCSATGQVYHTKDQCRKCHGERTIPQRKLLELYIPPGAKPGERIVLSGEADQPPGQSPGDLIFRLVAKEHPVFSRRGADLLADFTVSLKEALTGLDRVVLTHLDGRGISLKTPPGEVLASGDVLIVRGEGMPIKRVETKGDLYLVVKIEFPQQGWLDKSPAFEGAKYTSGIDALRSLLPDVKEPEAKPETVDEVEYEHGGMTTYGGDEESDDEWEDEDGDDDEPGELPQCQQQ